MNTPTAHYNKRPKQAKPKSKPIKVVYISNPMKVKTTASKFRALVQGLTGRDSDLADVEKILGIGASEVEPQLVPQEPETDAAYDEPSPAGPVPVADHEHESSASTGSTFPLFDEDVFTTEMLESFGGRLMPSSMLLEPQEYIFRSLDVV